MAKFHVANVLDVAFYVAKLLDSKNGKKCLQCRFDVQNLTLVYPMN